MIINKLIANPSNFEKGRTEKIEWIVMHYTGNKNDTAKNNALYFSRNELDSSAHYFVDDNDIYQSVLDSDTAYHCGAKKYKHPTCRNSNSIGIEMCGHNKNGVIYASKKTLENAAILVNMLCNKYNIKIDHIIRHYDVTGKLCPAYWIDNDGLDLFRKQVSDINKDKVSVITCCYNGEKYIKETIDSVTNQTYPNWELYVIDDGSTDSIKKIVKEYSKKDKRINYLYQEHAGTSSARNKGIKVCKGRYIALLDGDDVWHNDFLEKQLAFMKEKDAICVCSGYKIVKHDSSPTNIEIQPKQIITSKDMSSINHVACLTGLYDTSKYGKMYLNEGLYNVLDDYFYWYEISKKDNIYGNSEILADYRLSSNSTSSNKLKAIPSHYILYHKFMKQNILTSIKSIATWGLYGIKKYIKIYFLYNQNS